MNCRINRLSWLGHVEPMEDKRMPRKILTDKMHGTRGKDVQGSVG
jgi:hypothetical protein